MKSDWREAPLGEVCSFINRGVSPKYIDAGGVAVINQKCVRDHAVSFALARRHDVRAKSVAPERYVRVGDVLVNSTGTGTLGRVGQVREDLPEPATVDSHVTIVRPADGMFVREFFGYAMVSIESAIQSGGEGCGGQTELARSKLANDYRIRFPTDHTEQKRIVAILNRAFEAIDAAQACAERSLLTARELFDSYLDTRLPRVGDRRPAVTLVDVCEPDRPITYGVIKLGAHSPNGVPCLRTSNVRRLRIDTEGMKLITPALSAEYSRTILKGGELLVNVRGTLGGVAVVPPEMEGWNVSREVAVVPIDKNRIDPTFVSYVIASRASQEWLGSMKKGATYVGINIEDLRRLSITVPPALEQTQVIAEIESVAEQTKRLQENVAKKLKLVGALRGALLDRAFSGALGA